MAALVTIEIGARKISGDGPFIDPRDEQNKITVSRLRCDNWFAPATARIGLTKEKSDPQSVSAIAVLMVTAAIHDLPSQVCPAQTGLTKESQIRNPYLTLWP